MREVSTRDITREVKEAAMRANFELGEDILKAFERGAEAEESPVGREVLRRLEENAAIAKTERVPMCQDTGVAVVFAEIGQDLSIVDGEFYTAVEEGIREGYQEGFLRKSLCHPFSRQNTGDNTPIVLHVDLVKGDGLRIWVVPKGGGSENMSRLYMLSPSDGWPGVKERVVDTVEQAGPNPCPPVIVGVGIGGNFEQCALMAKRSLLRPVGSPNPSDELRDMEAELLEHVNRTGVGPAGLGGRVTCLAVHVAMMPCHIASLPLAVNLQCHASRHVEIEL